VRYQYKLAERASAGELDAGRLNELPDGETMERLLALTASEVLAVGE